jgi:branched-chain amino acid aminotransferase
VVKDNIEYVPPYGSQGSLYLRPVVLGMEPLIGLAPSKVTVFYVFVMPVGNYYTGGIGKPIKSIIQHGFNRAAPYGTGHVKVGGNYAPCFGPTADAKKKGYTITLFLDSKQERFIEEFATSNFAALTLPDDEGKRTYVTPKSRSILPSVTNRSLSELARKHFGWKVERRPIECSELSLFDEVAACGTAVVLTPVGEIHREIPDTSKPLKKMKMEAKSEEEAIWDDELEETFEMKVEKLAEFSQDCKGFKMLYDAYRQLQLGELDGWESYNWLWPENGI